MQEDLPVPRGFCQWERWGRVLNLTPAWNSEERRKKGWHHCWRQCPKGRQSCVCRQVRSSVLNISSLRLSETFKRNLWSLRMQNRNSGDSRRLKIRGRPQLRAGGWGCRSAQLAGESPKTQELSLEWYSHEGPEEGRYSMQFCPICQPLTTGSHLSLHSLK